MAELNVVWLLLAVQMITLRPDAPPVLQLPADKSTYLGDEAMALARSLAPGEARDVVSASPRYGHYGKLQAMVLLERPVPSTHPSLCTSNLIAVEVRSVFSPDMPRWRQPLDKPSEQIRYLGLRPGEACRTIDPTHRAFVAPSETIAVQAVATLKEAHRSARSGRLRISCDEFDCTDKQRAFLALGPDRLAEVRPPQTLPHGRKLGWTFLFHEAGPPFPGLRIPADRLVLVLDPERRQASLASRPAL